MSNDTTTDPVPATDPMPDDEAIITAGADYPPEVGDDAGERDPVRSIEAPPADADVNLAVPYIHQLWDTSDEFDGHWACGPTSSDMVLAYYGMLEPHPISVHLPARITPPEGNLPPGQLHQSRFGWYLSNAFDHDGHIFSLTAGAPKGRMAQGIYGTVLGTYCGGNWCAAWADPAHGKGIKAVMDVFLPQVGNTAKFSGPSPDIVKTTLESGHPVILSGKLFTWDHLIVIRGYYEDRLAGVTRWIVNDPFGYRTAGRFDGANVVYDWVELHAKWMVVLSGPHLGQPSA